MGGVGGASRRDGPSVIGVMRKNNRIEGPRLSPAPQGSPSGGLVAWVGPPMLARRGTGRFGRLPLAHVAMVDDEGPG